MQSCLDDQDIKIGGSAGGNSKCINFIQELHQAWQLTDLLPRPARSEAKRQRWKEEKGPEQIPASETRATTRKGLTPITQDFQGKTSQDRDAEGDSPRLFHFQAALCCM